MLAAVTYVLEASQAMRRLQVSSGLIPRSKTMC